MNLFFSLLLLCFITLTSAASPVLALQPSSIDFGDVVAGSTAATNLAVANAGDAPLHVSRVRACCGATASLSSATIPPSGEATLTLSVRPLAPNGAFKKNVFVHSDDPERPVFQLTLTGAAVAGASVPEVSEPQPSVPVVSASRDLSALTLTTILLAGLGLLILPWRPSAPEPVSATPEPVVPTNAVPAPVVTRTNAVRVIHVGRKQPSPELRQLRLRDVELAPDLASDEILARRNELLDLALSRK